MAKRITGYDIHRDDTDAQVRLDLASAIAKLTPRQQAIIALRCEGFTQSSITLLLGISRTTVWADEKEALSKIAGDYYSETIEERRSR